MNAIERILARAQEVDHAFQPIVSTSTLRTHGVEALARLPGAKDGSAILQLLDDAAAVDAVLEVERVVVKRALRKFAEARIPDSIRLFCNVDNRVFLSGGPDFDTLELSIREVGLSQKQVCWEISERDPMVFDKHAAEFVKRFAASDMRIALDDFGIGTSNLERLLVIEPHYVKIDRCFIDGLAANRRQQVIVAKLCGMAHALGYSTVAEGVESEDDFRLAREVGCDFAQGYLIARPNLSVTSIRQGYGAVLQIAPPVEISPRVAELLADVVPVKSDAPLSQAVERFNADRNLVLLPVVDRDGLVKGAIHERDIRQVLLSDYGRDLLLNRGAPTRIETFIKRCPVADIKAPVDSIVNSYLSAEGAAGLVLFDDGRYAGYLSNTAVLRLAAEREISQARDQNPLTRLPGNHVIEQHISAALTNGQPTSFAMLDFDFFKAFNDCYGFAAGDRLLQMFADALRQLQRQCGAFVGHIGGDDFFVSLPFVEREATAKVEELCTKFASDASCLYTAIDREAGGISGIDRYGARRFFPLLRASAALLHLPPDRTGVTFGMIEERLTALKSKAKGAPGGIASSVLTTAPPLTLRSDKPVYRLAS